MKAAMAMRGTERSALTQKVCRLDSLPALRTDYCGTTP
jgi:hypothetical protein